MKEQNHDVDFVKMWLNCKIEKLQEIESLCSAIMDVLEIPEIPPKPSSSGIRRGVTANSDHAVEKLSRAEFIDLEDIFSKMFDKIQRGEKLIEYTDWRQWYEFERSGGFAVNRLFYKTSDTLDDELRQDISENPLWIEIPPYGMGLDSFSAIRHDCEIVSELLKIDDMTFCKKDFDAIEHTVNGFIQGVFMLIGFHEKEHDIKGKLAEMYKEDLATRGSHGGSAEKIKQPILQSVILFLNEQPNRLQKSARIICDAFIRAHKEPKEIVFGGVDYDVYFE